MAMKIACNLDCIERELEDCLPWNPRVPKAPCPICGRVVSPNVRSQHPTGRLTYVANVTTNEDLKVGDSVALVAPLDLDRTIAKRWPGFFTVTHREAYVEDGQPTYRSELRGTTLAVIAKAEPADAT